MCESHLCHEPKRGLNRNSCDIRLQCAFIASLLQNCPFVIMIPEGFDRLYTRRADARRRTSSFLTESLCFPCSKFLRLQTHLPTPRVDLLYFPRLTNFQCPRSRVVFLCRLISPMKRCQTHPRPGPPSKSNLRDYRGVPELLGLAQANDIASFLSERNQYQSSFAIISCFDSGVKLSMSRPFEASSARMCGGTS